MRFGSSSQCRCLSLDGGSDDHADAHANATDDQQELSAKAVNGPDSIEGEQDAESSVESIDKHDLRCTLKDLLVDLSRISVERTLASDLLTSVDDKGDDESFSDRSILPEGRVGA